MEDIIVFLAKKCFIPTIYSAVRNQKSRETRIKNNIFYKKIMDNLLFLSVNLYPRLLKQLFIVFKEAQPTKTIDCFYCYLTINSLRNPALPWNKLFKKIKIRTFKTKWDLFFGFYRVPQSKFEANWLRGSWVMTNRHRFLLYMYFDVL